MSVAATRPWLAAYAPGVPADLPAPELSAIGQFRAAARRGPDAPAVHYFARTISYGELDGLSSAMAAAMAELGVRPGDRVALYLQNVPQFWVAQLAAWKLGAVVVPLNPMFKAQELEYHLCDSGAVALVTHEGLYADVARQVVPDTPAVHVITTSELDLLGDGPRPAPLAGAERRRLGETWDMLELCARHAGAADPAAPVAPADSAYLTYTSGTTGRPKGAMNTHANVAHNAEVYRVWMDLSARDVVVGAAPLFHITGAIAHLAAAALVGAPVILGYRFDAGALLSLIERWRGTFLMASITVYNALMHHPEIGARDLGSLTKCFSGGAPIAPALVERFQALTGAYIHNLYGLTETTSPSHAVPLGARAPVDAASGALSVGLPVPGAVVRVVDEAGQEVPAGTVGELWTSGPMVVPGYWRRPEDSERAVGGGWLRTGDVGWMDPAGWFFIVDRKKDMIIASGFKVWPREVEDVLYQHPAVREAAVIGVPDDYRGETVKAYVSLKGGAAADPGELIGFCRERLAAYKCPRQLAILPELPKTATGKLLRRRLRELHAAEAALAAAD
ncbi:MAG TPA: AMP-binding protein [Chloroflexaceae bacterium]|nr:AMP-binding protein [Chloroflexaceae bacterium]